MRNSLLLLVMLGLNFCMAQTFSTAVSIPITETNLEYCSPIVVSGLPQNLNCATGFGLRRVCIRINHTFTGDLDIFLKSPSGQVVELTTDNGGSGDNYGDATTSTCFNMASTSLITAGVAPFIAGSYLPEGNLNLFNSNVSGNGTWNLCITDDAGGDFGELISWNLEFGSPMGSNCATPTCSDGIMNQGETGIDCGGPCAACPPGPQSIIPVACSNTTINLPLNNFRKFYDDGGPGGNPCSEATVQAGNFCNCGCQTITTFCAPAGSYVIANFLEFAMFNTESGFDWMVIYDGPTTSGTILFDNRLGGPNNDIGDCGIENNVLNFCSTNNCITFQFNATTVVNRAGWDANVYSTTINCVIPLAEKLTSYAFTCNEQTRKMSWSVNSDLDVAFFEVERSRDGENWQTVEIISMGEKSLNDAFEVEDVFGLDNAYYRLKYTDFEGAVHLLEVSYSDCIAKHGEGLNVAPNPASESFVVTVANNDSAAPARIELVDISGAIVYTQDFVLEKGVQSIQVNLSTVKAGLYFATVATDNKRMTPVSVIVNK